MDDFSYGEPVKRPEDIKKKEVDAFHPVCLTCGYDMRGGTTPGPRRCPECGQPFVYREWERELRYVKQQIGETEEYLWWVPHAWKIAAVGIVVRLLELFMIDGGSGGYFFRTVAIICGAISFLMAINIQRVKRLPSWALPHLKRKPDYGGAFLGIGLGLALILSGIFLK